MTHTRITLVASILAATVVFAGGAHAAGSPTGYTDAAGDSKSAPDIQKVTVADGGNGTVGVEIDLAADIPDDGSVLLFGIDADRNKNTGDRTGLDYAVYLDATGSAFAKWDGTQWASAPHQLLSPSMAGGQVRFTLTLADVGAQTFDFFVASLHGDDLDVAPDDGFFTYPQVAQTVTIRSVVVNATALFATAGKTYAVRGIQVRLSNDQIVPADSTTCVLAYKGKPLKPLANCVWKIPKIYRKKHLILTLTATSSGSTSTIKLPVTPK
jgi:hypothetical protein